MFFNYIFGVKDVDRGTVSISLREAARAVIIQGNDILMVHTNKGDYKFPGGGVNINESHEQTLKREVQEETGFIVNNVKEMVGTVLERKIDEYKDNSIFQMNSYYYVCELSGDKTAQRLDDYESELDFQPVWISLDSAIHSNEEILKNDEKGCNSWVNRETIILKTLKEFYTFL